MAAAVWSVIGLAAGGLGLWALLLILASRREGIGLTRHQLREARRASDEQGHRRSVPAPRS